MFGFGTTYGALYMYDPEKQTKSTPKQVSGILHWFMFVVSRILAILPGIIPLGLALLLEHNIPMILDMVIGSAIPITYISFILTSGIPDKLHSRLLGKSSVDEEQDKLEAALQRSNTGSDSGRVNNMV